MVGTSFGQGFLGPELCIRRQVTATEEWLDTGPPTAQEPPGTATQPRETLYERLWFRPMVKVAALRRVVRYAEPMTNSSC